MQYVFLLWALIVLPMPVPFKLPVVIAFGAIGMLLSLRPLMRHGVRRSTSTAATISLAAIAIAYVRGDPITPLFPTYVVFTMAAILMATLTQPMTMRDLERYKGGLIACSGLGIVVIGPMLNHTYAVTLVSLTGGSDYEATSGYQFISLVFGMGAICASALARKRKRAGLLAVALLILSAAGGGRGEAIAALLLCAVMLPWRMVAVAAVPVVGIVVALGLSDVVTMLPSIWRTIYAIQHADLGMRDVLAEQALKLGLSDVSLFVFGGGANIFQKTYGYPYGLYPHNIIIEVGLTFGVLGLVAAVGALLCLVGNFLMMAYAKKRNDTLFMIRAIQLLLFLVALKGGNFWTQGLLLYTLYSVPPTLPFKFSKTLQAKAADAWRPPTSYGLGHPDIDRIG
jgi:hypothetical protein